VIGAGVCGLAAAYELSRRGERAIVLERGEPRKNHPFTATD
jgi:sarcosine oxidase